MFNENQKVIVKWHSSNKKYYMSIGIPFTKIGDSFEIPAKLLMKQSRTKVKYVCDYCGKEKETTYGNYLISHLRGKDCCKDCKQNKIKDTLLSKYGETSLWNIIPFRDKAKESMIKNYGYKYFIQSEKGKQKFKNSMKEKYGVVNPAYSAELQAKAKKTMYKNGNVPTSIPEQKLIKLLEKEYGKDCCKPGYALDKVNFDCLLIIDNNFIDVEYDGWYWHKDIKDYDRKRNYWVVSKGYKVLRILGNKKDELPSIDRIKNEIKYLLEDHNIGYINMNN